MLAPWYWIAEEAILWSVCWSTYYYVSAFGSALYYVSKFVSANKFEIEITPFGLFFLGQIKSDHQTCSGKLGRSVC